MHKATHIWLFTALTDVPMNDLIRGILRFVYQVTDPVLYKIRKALPFMVTGGMDLSPIALFILCGVLIFGIWRYPQPESL